jgi:uncharacterized protein YodC (DUF2158 family)
MDFKPGDIVILKCGGHPMVVAEASTTAIACIWMGSDGEMFREALPPAVLENFVSEDDEEDEDEDEDD